MTEICNECGASVAPGSGHFVSRVPDFNDEETRIEMGKPFPKGDYICRKCEEQRAIDAYRE
jgi:ribosomal protein L40E